MVKCLPTMQEMQVPSVGQEDLLEKEMATHSSILAWKIPWTIAYHGIFQARVLEWVAISFSRGSSEPRDQTWVFRIVGRHFTI